MAAPTPSVYSRQVGHGLFISWNAVWTTTDDMADVAVIDLSAMLDGYTNGINLQRVLFHTTGGIEFTLEFDATADEFLLSSVLAGTDPVDIDFTWNGLVKTATGGTGDLTITTTDAASGDEINLMIWARVN